MDHIIENLILDNKVISEDEDISLKYVNYQFRKLLIHFKELEDLVGRIIIKNCIFEDCQLFLNDLDDLNFRILMHHNQFLNCQIIIENSVISEDDLIINQCSFKNCMIKFIHVKLYNRISDFSDLLGDSSEIHFYKCIIYSYLNLERSTFKKIIFIHCMIENDVDLRVEYCDSIVIQESKISKIINLNYSHLNSLNIYDTINIGLILIDWVNHNVKDVIKNNLYICFLNDKHELSFKEISMNQIANQFLLLKENYRAQGKYAYEDYAYYEYRRHLYKKNIYGLMGSLVGKYGTSPLHILLYMIYTIILFSVLFLIIENNRVGYHNYLYFSGLTFFTIGYSDEIIIQDLSRIMAILEGFLGVFFMSYFTVSFVRKVLR